MKKNRIMRVFSVLLALTLISTCAISGTFAKYVTKAEGEDAARVAKWGIVLGVNAGDVFAKEYETSDKDGYVGMSVKADEKVVAPGTNSKEVGEDGLKATVFGTPEVATRYTLEIKDMTDIVLPKGEGYVDYTNLAVTEEDGKKTYGYTDTFDLDQDYAPVKWDLIVSNSNGKTISLVEKAKEYNIDVDGFSFTDAASIINNKQIMGKLLPELEGMADGASNAKAVVEDGVIKVSMDFAPGTEMDYTFELVWTWAFDGNDQADTYLGNLAAGIDGIVVPEGASTNLSASVVATATQID